LTAALLSDRYQSVFGDVWLTSSATNNKEGTAVTNRVVLGSLVLALLLLGSKGLLWAWEDHNRPDPLMDYVSQRAGMYDTVYPELDNNDCISCHGDHAG
jgi:hypothetical protein